MIATAPTMSRAPHRLVEHGARRARAAAPGPSASVGCTTVSGASDERRDLQRPAERPRARWPRASAGAARAAEQPPAPTCRHAGAPRAPATRPRRRSRPRAALRTPRRPRSWPLMPPSPRVRDALRCRRRRRRGVGRCPRSRRSSPPRRAGAAASRSRLADAGRRRAHLRRRAAPAGHAGGPRDPRAPPACARRSSWSASRSRARPARWPREIAAAGHAVAVHGDRHRNLLRVPPRGARATTSTGRRDDRRGHRRRAPRCTAPPYGIYSWPALRAVRARGWTPVLWSRWGRDWRARATPRPIAATRAARPAARATSCCSTTPTTTARPAAGARRWPRCRACSTRSRRRAAACRDQRRAAGSTAARTSGARRPSRCSGRSTAWPSMRWHGWS